MVGVVWPPQAAACWWAEKWAEILIFKEGTLYSQKIKLLGHIKGNSVKAFVL
jgi:hypothetical protein